MRHLKQEFDKLTFKDVLLYGIGFLTLVASFVLLFMGMLIPPEGEIHDSVLTAYGISLLFVAAIYGISVYFVGNLTSFKKSVLKLLASHNIKTEELEAGNNYVKEDKDADTWKREQGPGCDFAPTEVGN